MTPAFTSLPYKDQIETPVSALTPADAVPVSNPQDAGTALLGSAPLGAWTAGPWVRVPQTSGGDLIAHQYETGNQMNPKGLRLVAFMMSRGNSLKEDEANANLVCLAPELAEELRESTEWLEGVVGWLEGFASAFNEDAEICGAIRKNRALLSKLKGSN